MKLILASQSPRRKEIMEMIGFDFLTVVSEVDEKKIEENIICTNKDRNMFFLAKTLTEKLAYEKAKAVSCQNSGYYVIGSDTVVVSDDRILGKPKNEEEAYEMLKYLCGKTHRVYTGVSIVNNGNDVSTFSTYTEVSFYEFDEEIDSVIKRYIETKSPLDKAGAYGIQDMGALLIEKISGDYYTVMGLPAGKTYRALVECCENL